MSPSVPSDSSTIDTTFLVGPELVEFDRHDLPIYATLESRWADAGLDAPSHGASLDRLFGEPGEIFVSGMIGAAEQSAALAAATLPVEDPLVVLGGLSDGLILPAVENSDALAMPSGAQQAPEIVTIFDLGIDSFATVHLNDSGTWDTSDAWAFDYTA
ncbi:MAG: hypothetical protein Q8K93_05185 [Reyranella sp.]|uniref:hypothetical protein n=1 Tax=Reyranella sp. TaxID=1929291 RepID=UPI0027303729|nr:hypothetical protein [Reyranella sp.]MDP1961580.1 hypothetical protein [Reyranella sp.]MDP2374417.1 hypothetical protein [Reyranella sp.]